MGQPHKHHCWWFKLLYCWSKFTRAKLRICFHHKEQLFYLAPCSHKIKVNRRQRFASASLAFLWPRPCFDTWFTKEIIEMQHMPGRSFCGFVNGSMLYEETKYRSLYAPFEKYISYFSRVIWESPDSLLTKVIQLHPWCAHHDLVENLCSTTSITSCIF